MKFPNPKTLRQRLHEIMLEFWNEQAKTVLLPQLCEYSKLVGSNPPSPHPLQRQMFSSANANKIKARRCDLTLPVSEGGGPPRPGCRRPAPPPRRSRRGGAGSKLQHSLPGRVLKFRSPVQTPSSSRFWFLHGRHGILEGGQLKLKQRLAYSLIYTPVLPGAANKFFPKVSTWTMQCEGQAGRNFTT